MLLESFPPIFHKEASVLILGSMPGRASLDASQYYAHPRNLFWVLLSHALKVEPPSHYEERVEWLVRHGIAVWDVLKHCEREGSLDGNIVNASELPNDIASLFKQLPELKRVIFNGRKAEQAFKRHLSDLYGSASCDFICLPSSSPANAGIPLDKKKQLWKDALRFRGV